MPGSFHGCLDQSEPPLKPRNFILSESSGSSLTSGSCGFWGVGRRRRERLQGSARQEQERSWGSGTRTAHLCHTLRTFVMSEHEDCSHSWSLHPLTTPQFLLCRELGIGTPRAGSPPFSLLLASACLPSRRNIHAASSQAQLLMIKADKKSLFNSALHYGHLCSRAS